MSVSEETTGWPHRPPGALAAAEIYLLLSQDPPLASGLPRGEQQVQPHGLDISLDEVWVPEAGGRLGAVERTIAPRRELAFDREGWLHLAPGGYVVRFVETINLPLDLLALGFSRSTLMRSGCGLFQAVWDAGYRGRGEALFVVANPSGYEIQKGAQIAQLVFFRLPQVTEAYSGAYQENTG